MGSHPEGKEGEEGEKADPRLADDSMFPDKSDFMFGRGAKAPRAARARGRGRGRGRGAAKKVEEPEVAANSEVIILSKYYILCVLHKVKFSPGYTKTHFLPSKIFSQVSKE